MESRGGTASEASQALSLGDAAERGYCTLCQQPPPFPGKFTLF